MKFDELSPGRSFLLGPTIVTRQDILDFASRWDPQWFHIDESRATEGPFGGLIASGWHICAIAMRLMCQNLLTGSDAYVWPGLREIRWLYPVRPGDTLTLRATVQSSRPSASRPSMGITTWLWELLNQHGTLVMKATAAGMFRTEANKAIM